MSQLLRKHPSFFPVAFLVLMILVPYWRLTTMQGVVITDDIFTSDIMNDQFPYRFYIGEALRSGHLPLWYPPLYGGFPLLARAEAGVAFPPNLLLFGLLPPYVALNVVILLTLITAAAGMYLFMKELDVGTIGGLVASASFAFSGFMVAHLKHLSTVNAASLFPLGLYFIEKAFKVDGSAPIGRRAKPFMGLAMVIGLQNLAGHTQTAFYSGVAYLAYFVFRYVISRRKAAAAGKKRGAAPPSLFRDGRIIGFAAGVMIGCGIGAVQLLPTYELVTQSQRSGGVTFEYASNYAYDPANIMTFLYPYANGDIGNGTYRGKSVFWEDYGYAGVVALLLAVYAVVALRRKAHVKFFSAAAVVAFLLVLGPNTPVYEGVFHVVPGMKFFRFPTRFLLIVDFSLAVLAAFGTSHLLEGWSKREGGGSPMGFVVLALVVADLLYFQMRQNPVADMSAWLTTPKTVEKIKEDKGLFRIYSPGASETHKMAFSNARGWEGSLQPYLDQREFIQPGLNALYDLSTADGYAQLTPNYVVDLWGDQNRGGWIYETAAVQQNTFMPRAAFLKIISLFNVKYLITPWRVASGGLEPMGSPAGNFLYRNPGVMPRAFVVAGYRVVPGPDAAKAVLLSDDFDPRREAILYSPPRFSPDTARLSGPVEVGKHETNEVVVEAGIDRDGLLVLSDTFYPGWKAFVDGVETDILQANLCQRAVELHAGRHTVRFVFDSLPIKAGFGITLLSLCAALGATIFPRRREP